jgi:short-subunit dehydrogenase
MSYALITGASKGIGKAIAIELASRDIPVLLVARNEALLQKVSAEIINTYKVEAKYLAIDLSSNTASQQVVDWCNQQSVKVHILVNNAGYGLSGLLEKYSLQEHEAMMQLNMCVPVALSYLLLPSMKQEKKAYIMNIASGASYQAVPGLNVYAATKAFILSFSRGLRYELENTSVSVTVVAPGATDTDFANRASVTGAKAQKMAAKFNMQPNDVAKIAVDGMFANKIEVIPGFVNKLAVFFAWLLPKKLLEKSAAGIYDL